MKNKLLLVLSIAALSFSFACSEQKVQPQVSNDNLSDLPSWVLYPSIKNEIAAVGIANPSKGGLKFQIHAAELDAKATIAASIQSELSKVTKSALRSANVNGSDDVDNFFSQATKEVVKNIPLSGIKRVNGHVFKGDDGTLYIHMSLKKEEYQAFLKRSEENLQKSLQESGLSRENIDQSQAASKAIFDELDTERKQ